MKRQVIAKTLLGVMLVSLAMTTAASGESTGNLQGGRVAILIAEGYHDHEFWFPYYRFREAGAEVVVAGPRIGTVLGEGKHGKDGLPARVTHTIEEIMDQEFELVYIPGGIWAPMTLRAHPPALEFVRKAIKNGVLVAAICHASWVLVSADLVKNRRISCPSDMAVDVTNAGGIYVEDAAVKDGNLITAVYFGYLPEQFRILIPALRKRIADRKSLITDH